MGVCAWVLLVSLKPWLESFSFTGSSVMQTNGGGRPGRLRVTPGPAASGQ